MRALVDPANIRIKLLAETSALGLDTNKIARFLENELSKRIKIEDGTVFNEARANANMDIARKLAVCKITGNGDSEELDPFPMEIEYESKRMSGHKMASSPMYDGFKLSTLFREKLSIGNLNQIVFVYTDRLVGSFGEDYRWHARTVIFSYPCIISVAGIVTAPARSKQYYLAKQLVASISKGSAEDMLVEDSEDHIRGAEDPRVLPAINSYTAQALFFSVYGEPFCPTSGCRLFNSHWQRDVLDSQVNGKLCNKHKRLLEQ